eukprot:5213380-Prymnesium_polylepis.1
MGGWVACDAPHRHAGAHLLARVCLGVAGALWPLRVGCVYHDLLQLSVHAGVTQWPLGDDLVTDPQTDRSKPHNA